MIKIKNQLTPEEYINSIPLSTKEQEEQQQKEKIKQQKEKEKIEREKKLINHYFS